MTTRPEDRKRKQKAAAAGYECVLVDGMLKYQPVGPPAKKTRMNPNIQPQMAETEVRKLMMDPAFRETAKSKKRCALSFCPCIDVPIPGQLHRLSRCDVYAKEWKEFLVDNDPCETRHATSEVNPLLCTCHFPSGEPTKYPIITKCDLQSMLEKERESLNKLNEGLQKVFSDEQLAMIYDSETGVQKWSDQVHVQSVEVVQIIISGKKYNQVIDILKIPFPTASTVRTMCKNWEEEETERRRD